MQIPEIIERILRSDVDGPLNDCIDNDGKPYQSQFLATTLKAAKDWLETPPCTFCAQPAGLDSISDRNGEVACKACGEAELESQRAESKDA